MLAEVPQEHINPTVDHYMKLIIGQLNFMQAFVDALLDLRMLREGAFQLTMASFNPKSIVELCYRIFKPQAAARNLAFNYQICERLAPPPAPQGNQSEFSGDDFPSPRIYEDLNEESEAAHQLNLPILIGDERRFKQVMVNLIKNALKFTQ